MLETRLLLSGTPIISEFLAGNSGGLQDEDGESSDWLEIYNPTPTAINLQDWSLTDDPDDLNEWVFPDVTLGANQFLTVFASDKNRAGPELHTNFKLSAEGDFLALVDPNGTIVSQYSPAYPEQVDNISYGVAFDTANVIQPGAGDQVLIPSNGTLGNSWTTTTFNPAGWISGTTGVGYGVVHPGFNVLYAKANVLVNDLGVARDVLADPAKQSFTINTTAPVVNYMGNGGGGHYANDFAFPNQTIGDDINDFVVQATGTVTIPSAGNWTFGVNSDDGFELRLERNGVVLTSEFFNPRGPSDTLKTFNVPTAGDWQISTMMYERGGGASYELFAASGTLAQFSTAFRLVGDAAAGGLTTYAPLGTGTGVVVGTNVQAAMKNVNASAYIRVPFSVSNPAAYDALLLTMQYDDGFVAYVNGVEVARRNAPSSLAYNSAATADRSLSDATTPETINLTPFLHLLQAGNNVLAIQGLNSSAGDDSFLILPQLVASAVHTDQLRYFHTTTPGAPNIDPALGLIDRVSASVNAGFYSTPFSVVLTTPSFGATIRYTTDGSTPTATHGTVYTTPITVSATTTLRAGAFRTDYLSLPTITRSYLFLNDVISQSPSDDVVGGAPDVGAPPPGWPATWGSNVVDYGMDQTIVNQAGAAAVKSALLAIPSLSITTDLANLFDPTIGIYANPRNDGRDWERPASVEWLNPNGSPGFQINAGLRVRGGFSRSTDNPKHAFRLFFRGEYGDSSLEYPFFGNSGTDTFKNLDLRTAQNYSWSFGGDPSNTMIQDGFARQSQLDMGQPSTRSVWFHLYLDGHYWGVFQIEERPEAEFASSYFGGNPNNYDVIKPEAGPYTNYATDGNMDAYQRLWQYVTTQDLSNNGNYYYIQGKNAQGVNDSSVPDQDVLVDVDNLIVYMLGILHGGNLDAPISNFLSNQGINNYFAIRDRTGRSGFKFIQHDAEHTLHNVNENRNGPYPAGQTFDRFNPQFLHQQLMANAEYRLRFADIVQKHFFGNGAMTAASGSQRFQNDVTQLDQAIIAESARWGDAKRPTSPLGRADWLNAVSAMQGFLANRNPILLQQFRTNGLFPLVDAPQFLINGVPRNSGEVVPGSVLRMAAPAGLVYYTTDGSDPRLISGGINPAAQVYDPSSTQSTLLATNSSWKYFDQGTDLGTAWRSAGFSDSTWLSGNAELGYGDGDEATVLGFGPDANNKFITTYFRKTFSVANASGVTGLKLRLKRDDGAVVYINGVEATRTNMPLGSITASSPALAAVGGTDEQTFYEFDIDPGLLHSGSNLMAVELHQSAGTSTDISFDASLIASVQSNPGLLLNASINLIARTLSGPEWSAAAAATFIAAGPAVAGNLAITEIHFNPTAMSGATTAPFNDKENFEFIELRNVSNAEIKLANVQFTVGITFNFSAGAVAVLQPWQHVVVVKNLQAFEARYGTGVLVAGVFSGTGNLSNGGEQLRLIDATGATIQDFTYDDDLGTTPPWPAAADGGGQSLTVRSVTGNYNLPANWRASYLLHGTPGYDENDYPASLNLAGGSVNENAANAVAGTLSASDPNHGDTFTYTLVDSAGGQFILSGAQVLVASGVLLNYEAQASYNVTIRVTDAGGLALDKSFAIAVNDVNDAPAASNASLVTGAFPASNGALMASDEDGDAVTYAIVARPAHGTVKFNPTTGAYVFTPYPNYSGSDSFTFKASDGALDSNVATVTITIETINEAPQTNQASAYTNEDTATNGTLTASDADGDTLNFTIVSGPSHGTLTSFDAALGTYTYLPDANYYGNDSFVFIANDGTLDSNPATISITVSAVNDSPTLTAYQPSLGTATPDTASARTRQIARLLEGHMSDADGSSSRGIAITFAKVLGSGHWQYRYDKLPWTRFDLGGAPAQRSALLLPARAYLRYVSAAISGSVFISYRAWDQSQGTSGSRANLSSHAASTGGSTAFSRGFDYATLTVTNARPVLTQADASPVGYLRDSAPGVNFMLGASIQARAQVTDPDSANFDQGRLQVQTAAGAQTGDRLFLSWNFSISGTAVKFLSTQIGTMTSNGKDGNDLTILFNSQASRSLVERLVNALRFKTERGAAGTRTLRVNVSDGDGGLSDTLTRKVVVSG